MPWKSIQFKASSTQFLFSLFVSVKPLKIDFNHRCYEKFVDILSQGFLLSHIFPVSLSQNENVCNNLWDTEIKGNHSNSIKRTKVKDFHNRIEITLTQVLKQTNTISQINPSKICVTAMVNVICVSLLFRTLIPKSFF